MLIIMQLLQTRNLGYPVCQVCEKTTSRVHWVLEADVVSGYPLLSSGASPHEG
jgi:hypothetical protein